MKPLSEILPVVRNGSIWFKIYVDGRPRRGVYPTIKAAEQNLDKERRRP